MPGAAKKEDTQPVERHSENSQSLSRRDLFSAFRNNSAVQSALKPVLAATASALALSATAPPAEAAPRSVSADIDKNALLAKLVRRITWGFTQEEYALARQLGYEGYLEYHLNPAAINDSVLDGRLAAYTTLGMPSNELFNLTAGQVVSELSEAMILRAVYSKRQLFERMVDFWTDHFSIDIDVDLCFYLKTPDDRNVIRANAMGNFPDMLRASIQSPCMLKYLANDTNVSIAPNENYARELMELHTLSVDGPYTQNDVQEVARCFTGVRLHRLNTENRWGHLLFESMYHDNGSKRVLGRTIPANGGLQDIFAVADILQSHPSTARFISSKLCKKFLGEDVPPSLIESIAAVYVSTGGDIKAMLRAILRPENLYTDYGPRFKRPQHMMISALRALPTPITSTQILRITHLNGAGQIPFNWSPPDGYPDTLAHWQGLALARWNFAALLVTDAIPGITFDVTSYFLGHNTALQMIDKIDSSIFGGELPAAQRTQLLNFLSVNPSDPGRRRDTVGLALSAPAFQWY